MKTLPTRPYLQNIVKHYHDTYGEFTYVSGDGRYEHYGRWLTRFGFKVPVGHHLLEFPDDFSDQELLLFQLRWA